MGYHLMEVLPLSFVLMHDVLHIPIYSVSNSSQPMVNTLYYGSCVNQIIITSGTAANRTVNQIYTFEELCRDGKYV